VFLVWFSIGLRAPSQLPCPTCPPPAQVLGTPLPYNSLDDVRRRLADVAPHFGRRDAVEAPLWLNGEYFKVRMRAGGEVASAEERLSLLRCGT